MRLLARNVLFNVVSSSSDSFRPAFHFLFSSAAHAHPVFQFLHVTVHTEPGNPNNQHWNRVRDTLNNSYVVGSSHRPSSLGSSSSRRVLNWICAQNWARIVWQQTRNKSIFFHTANGQLWLPNHHTNNAICIHYNAFWLQCWIVRVGSHCWAVNWRIRMGRKCFQRVVFRLCSSNREYACDIPSTRSVPNYEA